ncbi:MAG: hypothetical protein AAB276_00595 [Pseudomonadota bacterium]
MQNRADYASDISSQTLKDLLRTWLAIVFFTFATSLFLIATKSSDKMIILSQTKMEQDLTSNSL